MVYTLISYCNNTWPLLGGVARYDTQLSLIFPDRIFFKGPEYKLEMLSFLKTCSNPIIITDNHLACDIPNKYPILLVHHGCALTTSERNPKWNKQEKYLCCKGQKEMLVNRDPSKTWIISISKACSDDFTRYFPNLYPKFKRLDVLHPSELDESKYKKSFNKRPIILGNWSTLKKGIFLIPRLTELCPEFEFRMLSIKPYMNESLKDFNDRKQAEYLKCDMFLQIANSEGFSYASNDAMICGLVPICTNVGGFYKDVDDDSFVKLDWKKCFIDMDYEYIRNGILYGWNNKEIISKNARNWYLKNCRFVDWSKKMIDIVNNFYIDQYSKKKKIGVSRRRRTNKKKNNKMKRSKLIFRSRISR